MTSLSTYNQLKENPTKDNINALVDQMFVMLDTTDKEVTLKIFSVRYTVAAILHNRNYDIVLIELPSELIGYFGLNSVFINIGQNKTDYRNRFINLMSHIVTYNMTPSMDNVINILRDLIVVEGDINFRRYEFIYMVSNNFQIPSLKLNYTLQQV